MMMTRLLHLITWEEGGSLLLLPSSIGPSSSFSSQPPGPNYRLEIGRTFRPISDDSALNRALPSSCRSSGPPSEPQSGQVMAPRLSIRIIWSRSYFLDSLPFFAVHTSHEWIDRRSGMIVSYRHCDFERRVIIDSPPWRYLVLEREEREGESCHSNPDLCLH